MTSGLFLQAFANDFRPALALNLILFLNGSIWSYGKDQGHEVGQGLARSKKPEGLGLA